MPSIQILFPHHILLQKKQCKTIVFPTMTHPVIGCACIYSSHRQFLLQFVDKPLIVVFPVLSMLSLPFCSSLCAWCMLYLQYNSEFGACMYSFITNNPCMQEVIIILTHTTHCAHIHVHIYTYYTQAHINTCMYDHAQHHYVCQQTCIMFDSYCDLSAGWLYSLNWSI